jgi:hypothetical protein
MWPLFHVRSVPQCLPKGDRLTSVYSAEVGQHERGG